ncbi:MAG: hypothetical protein U9R37_09155, partial [Campylobacterota bacterium]|nr:hypothetical protein [Campylobacterota bacterium]
MLKIIVSIFIAFMLIILMIVASLFSGISIDDISYNNIQIKRLYLKYDKSLIVSAQKIIVEDKITKDIKSYKIRAKIFKNKDDYK